MLKDILVPDIGDFSNVEIIEILIKEGQTIAKDASLLTLETDKATMEIPSPYAGVIKSLKVKVGDRISKGDLILQIETESSAQDKKEAEESSVEAKKEVQKTDEKVKQTQRAEQPEPAKQPELAKQTEPAKQTEKVEVAERTEPQGKAGVPGVLPHAGPSVRRFARELGVDLSRVKGTGRNDRILTVDVQQYVKAELKRVYSGQGDVGTQSEKGLAQFNIPPWPAIDHSQFGPISEAPLSRIKKLSGSYLWRNWLMVPHITQFDEADITELEQFRKESQSLAQEGIKLTPLVFIMKAVVAALEKFPNFNASLNASGTELIMKQYFHIGVAVDTPNGLVVPVVRDVDKKGVFKLAQELGEISQKARKGQLKAQDMQGSSFSISSLGGIGGTAFTPIINVPDVAILGVSKSSIKPVYKDNQFIPRLILPLSLSYDHRVIDGAEAARFIVYLSNMLSDIRRLLL